MNVKKIKQCMSLFLVAVLLFHSFPLEPILALNSERDLEAEVVADSDDELDATFYEDEQSGEIIAEEIQEDSEQEEDEGPIVEEINSDGQVGEVFDGQMNENDEIEEANASTRNPIPVTDFAGLQREIANAPTDGTLTTINILNHIDNMNALINITGGRNIRIQSTGNHTLTRTGTGRHFNVQANSELTLGSGVTLTRTGTGNSGGVQVSNGGRLTMEGGTISGKAAGTGGGVNVLTGGTLIMEEGGTISGNTATNTGSGGAGGVAIASGGIFTMYGGTISGNTSNFNGGGIQINNGTFTMYDGTISGNVGISGGGVHVSGNNGVFTMHDGTIKDNRATSATAGGGGARSMNGATINIYYGEIRDNVAHNVGGGVSSGAPDGGAGVLGFLNIQGGIISGNRASEGGGIDFQGGRLYVQGATIKNNHATSNGGGINFWQLNPDNLLVAEEVYFSGNTAGSHIMPAPILRFTFPNIRTTSSSIFDHPLNNYDIGFRSSQPVLPIPRIVSVLRNPEEGGYVTINGESIQNTIHVWWEDGMSLDIEAVPALGYAFSEWESTDGSFADVTSADTVFAMPDADTTITALFKPSMYEVSFHGNGGDVVGIHTITVQHGTTFGSLNPPTATRNNWHFVDWFTESTGGLTIPSAHEITEPMSVYAQWDADIRFMMNDGTNDEHVTQVVREGEELGQLPMAPIRPDYIFEGWNTLPDGSGTTVTPTWVPMDGHQAIYAQWERDWRLDVEIPTAVFFFSDQDPSNVYDLISGPEGFAITNGSNREIHVTVEGFEHVGGTDEFNMIEELRIEAEDGSGVSVADEVELISVGAINSLGSDRLMVISSQSGQSGETAIPSVGRFRFSGRVNELPHNLINPSFNLVLGFGVE